MNLIEQIETAFGDGPPPKEPLMEPEYLDPHAQGDEGATAYFSGKKWRELDTAGLRYHECAMYMFTPEAHRYYLPAFMIASLKDRETADMIPDNLIYHLSLHADAFWWKRIEILSSSELDAVSNFVRASDAALSEDREKALRGLGLAKMIS